MPLNVTLNGEARQLPGPTSVAGMLTGLGLDPAKIAVERNLAIVPRSTYASVAVEEGDIERGQHRNDGGRGDGQACVEAAADGQPQ